MSKQNVKSVPVADKKVPEGQAQENAAPTVPAIPVFSEAKEFNAWERELPLPTFPQVSLGTWTISESTVARIFRAGIERLVSATTAPVKGSKDTSIRELLDLLASGFLTASEKEKASKVVSEKSGRTVYFSRPEIMEALVSLGYKDSADYIATLDAARFDIAYKASVLNTGSKIAAAHAYCVAEAARRVEEAQRQALSGLDESLL